jgi:hypothetical protein
VESGFTTAFVMSALGMAAAFALALAIPGRARERVPGGVPAAERG